MRQTEQLDLPGLADTLLTRSALALMLLGAGHALTLAERWLYPSIEQHLSWVRLTLSGAIPLLLLPATVRFALARRRRACDTSSCDGYLLTVFRRACVAAFTVTFIVLVALESLVGHLPAAIDRHVLLSILLTATLWMLAGSFFVQTLGGDAQDDDP